MSRRKSHALPEYWEAEAFRVSVILLSSETVTREISTFSGASGLLASISIMGENVLMPFFEVHSIWKRRVFWKVSNDRVEEVSLPAGWFVC